MHYCIVQSLVRNIITILNIKDIYDFRVESLDSYTTRMVKDYLGEELFNNTDLIMGILFDEIDFTKFSKDAVDFYLDVFGTLLPSYVDAYNIPCRRKNVKLYFLQ